MKPILSLAIVPVALVAGGCLNISFTPKPDTLDGIPEYSCTGELRLENLHDAPVEVVVGKSAYKTWHTDLQACTDAVIAMIHREVSERGMTIDESGSKSISLSVEKIEFDVGFATMEAEALLRAETSSGYSGVYSGRARAVMAGKPLLLFNGTLIRATEEMLRDPKIIAFLSR